MFRLQILCLLFFMKLFVIKAQTDSTSQRPLIFAGLGNYEYLHAGINFPIKKKHYFEIAVGIKPWGFNDANYQMLYLCYGRKLFKEVPRKINLFLHLKVLTWHYNNQYNEFVVLGVNPELRLTYALNKKYLLALNGGILYNSPFYYDRKTYQEIGWPNQWQPSFSLQFLYRLK
jgi:hypothetical protein